MSWEEEELYCVCKGTNFESNSQQTGLKYVPPVNCIASAKVLILKAIHNELPLFNNDFIIVLRLQRY